MWVKEDGRHSGAQLWTIGLVTGLLLWAIPVGVEGGGGRGGGTLQMVVGGKGSMSQVWSRVHEITRSGVIYWGIRLGDVCKYRRWQDGLGDPGLVKVGGGKILEM